MKIIISESAGRNQAWFDAQTKIVQRQYLADHPNSKFVAKKSAAAKSGVHTHAMTNGGHISVKHNGKEVMTFKPSQLKSTLQRMVREGAPSDLRKYVEKVGTSQADASKKQAKTHIEGVAKRTARVAENKKATTQAAAKRRATDRRSAAAPVPVRTLKRDIKAKQAELDEHLAKKPRSEAGKAKHAATTKELQSSLRKLGRQHAKATETLAGQDRVLKAIDSKNPAAKSPVKVKRGVPSNPNKPARFAGPRSHPSNRGTGNTVMGPGWKKKSGVGEHEWNTYEHPDGHQVRVSKTAGTAYQQGQGPARKVKVHKVETKAAGSKQWSNYGEVEKHQVSDAGRGFPKAKREKEIPDYALGDKNYVERKALESAKDRAHKRASDADTMMRVLLNRRGVPDKAAMDALKAKIAKANAQATELEAKIKALK